MEHTWKNDSTRLSECAGRCAGRGYWYSKRGFDVRRSDLRCTMFSQRSFVIRLASPWPFVDSRFRARPRLRFAPRNNVRAPHFAAKLGRCVAERGDNCGKRLKARLPSRWLFPASSPSLVFRVSLFWTATLRAEADAGADNGRVHVFPTINKCTWRHGFETRPTNARMKHSSLETRCSLIYPFSLSFCSRLLLHHCNLRGSMVKYPGKSPNWYASCNASRRSASYFHFPTLWFFLFSGGVSTAKIRDCSKSEARREFLQTSLKRLTRRAFWVDTLRKGTIIATNKRREMAESCVHRAGLDKWLITRVFRPTSRYTVSIHRRK